METFMKVYAEQLEKAVHEHLEDYWYGVEQVPAVLARMRLAIDQHCYSKDSCAFREACKVLKIKHTYKAIDDFIANHV